jgi:hypothetical protein
MSLHHNCHKTTKFDNYVDIRGDIRYLTKCDNDTGDRQSLTVMIKEISDDVQSVTMTQVIDKV